MKVPKKLRNVFLYWLKQNKIFEWENLSCDERNVLEEHHWQEFCMVAKDFKQTGDDLKYVWRVEG